MEPTDKSQTITDVCAAIKSNELNRAKSILRDKYRFISLVPVKKAFSPAEMTRLFARDGFIDRYSGERLVFTPVLRVLSRVLPTDFPYHPNWKMSECHIAYWEVTPTIDHIIPLARGGSCHDSNLATTSMLRNGVKANWTLEELDWKLMPPGDSRQWDGLLKWFVKYIKDHQELLGETYFASWYGAADAALSRSHSLSA